MIKVIFIALFGAFVSITLKKFDSNLSFLAAILTGVIIISLMYVDLEGIIRVVKTFGDGYGVDNSQVKLLLKVLGISFVTRFGISIAEDCGEKFIAQKIDFAGRVFITAISVPILINLLNTILDFI